MLNKNACQLATNLARILYDQSKDLVPESGSLVQELTSSSFRDLPSSSGMGVDSLAAFIEASSSGPYSLQSGAATTYNASKHDALMDNYIETLSTLVSNHLVFARTVVYPKVNALAALVSETLKSHELQQPEDFFEVTMYRLPEVFETDLVASEVLEFKSGSSAHHVFNFGDSLLSGFNLVEYISTGDEAQDALVSAWIAQEGAEKLQSYVLGAGNRIGAAMPLHEQINSHFINFLFYRSLALRQDLNVGRSVIQLVTASSDNRDHYAQELRSALNTYRLYIKQGVVIAPHSEVNFSYMADRRFAVTLYEDSFAKAAELGATLEQVFGFISQRGSVDLTVQELQNRGASYAAAWSTVRDLYLTYITGRRDLALKMALKLHVNTVLYNDPSEQEKQFYADNPSFQEQTAKMVQQYISALDTMALERTQEVFIDLIAGIGFRHSSAARIIRDMASLLAKGDVSEAAEAAMHATVKYVTDFLVEQVTVTAP